MVSAPEDGPRTMPTNFLTFLQVEPVGKTFLSHWHRLHTARGPSTSGLAEESESGSDSEADEQSDEVVFEDDLEYLRSLDPKQYKDQDHYKVLGIGQLRQRATDEQIKKAYRFKVLKHHPDKRRAAGEEIREDDDYFTCITKASEILGAPLKRRAYDSVDPTFDDDVPEMKAGQDFYATFAEAFENNARWSNKRPVPKLGGDDLTREKVDKFYEFWYNFDSWREFSYLDEEDKEKGSDRYERRWIEKNNKGARLERKKEENARMRKLVDNAYNSDPRVKRFLEADKQEKLDRKKARQDAAKARREEEERVVREEKERELREKEAKELAEKTKQEAIRKEKEEQRKALKKERRKLRLLCKENDFYVQEESEQVKHMTELDRLCEILSSVELVELNEELADKGRDCFLGAIDKLNKKLGLEQQAMMERSSKGSGADKAASGASNWSTDDMALLVKAVNMFPAGTVNRWVVIANFINQHTKTPELTRHAKETLGKAKELQQGQHHLNTLKDEVNKKAYENLEKQQKRTVKVESAASERTETAAEVQGLNVSPWSPDEQKLLEQALKTYPASIGAERWDKIASCLPDRSRKDCMKRYKELAEIIRAKKAAQAAAQAQAK